MNKVRRIWQEGGQVVGGWLQMGGALPAEAMAACGYDALVIDLQHSLTDFATAVSMLTAIENGGAEPFVRMQWNDPGSIMRMLDAGAYGIIVPMVETREEALRIADAIHYPPRGARSFGPRRPVLRYGVGYAERASETIVSMAMIETRRGIENLEDILSVDGIDGVFIGPNDLSLALGKGAHGDSDDPDVVAMIRHIRERVHAAGKRAGIYSSSAVFARTKLQEGFDFVTATPDLAMLTVAARATLQEIRQGSRTHEQT